MTTTDEDRRNDDEDTKKAPREPYHQWELKVGNCNISSLRRKEQGLVDEVTNYPLDIFGLSSTKRPGSGLLNLNGWKLFYSGVDITTRAQAGVARQNPTLSIE
ncbi:unnamed protein product [Soboliphyme baturini]|uniref:Uncharacterized protein n=1 Tax=Soboliphyme baturini TaxID=241478 RepID=A0A183J7Z2_9BILA|nr:unnamed protein product [Soboliphyme baturini]